MLYCNVSNKKTLGVIILEMAIEVKSEFNMKKFGQFLGSLLRGGEVIELIGDVGAGKTTLVKGIAKGLGVTDAVQSPSFTVNRVYKGRDGLELSHYDFYRLHEAGLMAHELDESLKDKHTITVIEWGDSVTGVMPLDRLTIQITSTSETKREVSFVAGGLVSHKLIKELEK